MKVIIAGSRKGFTQEDVDEAVIKSGFNITEVVCGEAYGVDSFGKNWAIRNNIPVVSFKADWDGLGKAAGILRNEDMKEYGEALIALIHDNSRGTADMIKRAEKKGIPTYIKRLNSWESSALFQD